MVDKLPAVGRSDPYLNSSDKAPFVVKTSGQHLAAELGRGPPLADGNGFELGLLLQCKRYFHNRHFSLPTAGGQCTGCSESGALLGIDTEHGHAVDPRRPGHRLLPESPRESGAAR